MDNKYKALSYIPPKPIKMKQRFGKLTLAACASAEKTKPSVPPTTKTPTSRKALYTYKNPNNNDVRISDDSIITDDESSEDDSPSGSERNKIINNILNSDNKIDDDDNMVDEPNRRWGNEMSQFSEKLLLNDSDETNCGDVVLETEMKKLEISLNPCTPLQKKSSTPLFSTTSDTIVSRLSSQLDRMGLNEPKLIKPVQLCNDNADMSVTNVSILTISSTISGDDSEFEENTDENESSESDCIILSSDEDVNDIDNRGSSESEIEKHVSTLSHHTSDTLNTQVKQNLSDFFNNIPSPESPERHNNSNGQEIVPETPEGPEFIPETPENLSLNDEPIPVSEPIVNTESSVVKINSEVVDDPNITNEAEDTHVSINISTKIQINIQISELEKTRCESTEPSGREPDIPEQPQHDISPPPISDMTNSLVEDTSPIKESNTNKFAGLNQTDIEIDEEMEGILNELYGKTWQTPQLLKKCLSTKKQVRPKPTTQMKVTEQIDDTDFSLFGKKINEELESTRLPDQIMPISKPAEAKEKTSKKKLNTSKKAQKKFQESESDEEQPLASRRLDFGKPLRPKRQAALKSKELLKVRDYNTSDSEGGDSFQNGSDSDLNFTINVNDINTDDDDDVEKENRKDRHIKKVLDRCEYTKKPSIQGTPPLSYLLPPTQKPGNSKRKLFTPQNHDIVLPEESPPPKPNRSSSDEALKPIADWLSLKNKKIEAIKKNDLFDSPKPRTVPKEKKKAEPKSTAKNKSPAKVGDQTYGFIQSLDEKIGLEYCHPDAIKYRKNYAKTKVELGDRLYDLYNKQIFDFPQRLDLTWNKKLLTTAGRCLTKRTGGVRTCRVELSEKVLTSAARLRCTLVHELCHAATWLFDGANGHGSHWKAWASKSMKVFPELPTIAVCHSYDIEYKYVYMCLDCNVKQPAHSKSIKVDTKRCKYCYGKIEVFQNKKTRDGDIVQTPIRKATGFAKFVQEQYGTYKTDQLKHGDVMKILGTKFRELAVVEQK